MKKILLLSGALSLLMLTSSKKKKGLYNQQKYNDAVYISKDGTSICNMKTQADINIAADTTRTKKIYNDFLGKNQDATIYDLARHRVALLDKHNIVPDVIDADCTSAVKFIYINALLGAALHMTFIGRMPKPMLASWVFDEEGFPKTLHDLDLLEYGNWQESLINARAAALSDESLLSIINNQISLAPNIKEISSEVFATLMVIMVSTIVKAEARIDCTKINDFAMADYTSFSDKGLNPAISTIYSKFFNIFLGVKQGL